VQCYDWIEKFRNGHTSIKDEWSGCPSTCTTADNIEHACDMVLANRLVTVDEVAAHLLTVDLCNILVS